MGRAGFLPAGVAVVFAVMACAAPVGGEDSSVLTSVAATLTQVAASAPTDTPEPTPTPLPPRLWKSYTSGGASAWWLEDGAVSEVTLPVEPGQYYDYSTVNGKILYASHFASVGAGPSRLAVSDLWMIDYPAGSPTVLIGADSVVEALWAPDGAGFVYIHAAAETYELRYRSLAGDDRLLTSHVAPTWSVSPLGDLVAFTRETGYGVPGAPGLYVVPLAGGPERMISDADRHGAGSIEDRPIWTSDATRLALPNYGFAPGALVLASADGSSHGSLSFAGDLAADPAVANVPVSVLWHPDGAHLLGVANFSETMGGPSPIYRYALGTDGTTAIAATRIGEGYSLIDWHIPGMAFYAVDPNNDVVVVWLP